MRLRGMHSQPMITKLTEIIRIWSLISNLLPRKKRLLQLLLIAILSIGNFAVAEDVCSMVFGKTERISYHVGDLIKSEEFPAPKYSVYFLGEGEKGGRVNRVVDNEEGTSFVVKYYESSKSGDSVAALKHDRRMLKYLSKQQPERYGIRIVKELGLLNPHTIVLEDVRGITLEEAILKRVLPTQEIKALVNNLLNFQKDVLAQVQKNFFANGRIFFSEIASEDFPKGIPILYFSTGFLGRDNVYLRKSNILLDVETRTLVIIDPY